MDASEVADRIGWAVSGIEVELPSWGFANSGTRFRVYPQPGVPRTPFEKVDDAATIARFTGVARRIALHIPWDRVDDFAAFARYAGDRGVKIGGINSNTFQDEAYRLGSLCHPSPVVRTQAIRAIVECCEIARETRSDVVKVWLADGTNYPGQDDLRSRRRRLVDSLRDVYGALPDGVRLLLEYKLYEPAFYHTDVADWGVAVSVCQELGENAMVCVDIGHHAPTTNIEHIVASLLAVGRLGGFDLNDKKYGDDDLMVGSIDPYQLFRICHELVGARSDAADPVAARCAHDVAYMIDQSHNIEPKIPALITSVMALQAAMAKALLVDRTALEQAQVAGDVLEANRILRDAFDADVRPALAQGRVAAGLPADPYAAYLESGLEQRRAAERVGGTGAGWA
jgi:L-rhamnose isomerase/sugar isomerase